MSEMFTCDTGHEPVVYVCWECPVCEMKKKVYLLEEEIEKLKAIKIKELKGNAALV